MIIINGLILFTKKKKALACGADASYIKEEEFNIIDLMECLYRMADKFETKRITRGLILRSNISIIHQIYFYYLKKINVILIHLLFQIN